HAALHGSARRKPLLGISGMDSSLHLQYPGRGVALARVRDAPAGAGIRKIGVARQRDAVAALSLVNLPAGDGDGSRDDPCRAMDCPAQTEYLGWHPHSRRVQCDGLHRDRNGTRDANITASCVTLAVLVSG